MGKGREGDLWLHQRGHQGEAPFMVAGDRWAAASSTWRHKNNFLAFFFSLGHFLGGFSVNLSHGVHLHPDELRDVGL